jgi:exodeoxyribonuclease VII large subunit
VIKLEREYITVGALNKYLKTYIDSDPFLQTIYLKGELSNFKAHTSGHYYFTIKDETSRVKAVMFAFNNRKLPFQPQDGMKVLITGQISVYEASGSYQVYVEEMLEDGLGNLFIAYEQLKKKLQAEGLFDYIHKKKIPKIPSRVGIITAPTGAAIKDIISTIKRRYPLCETILFPSLVQGSEAKDDLVWQLKRAEDYHLDVLIIGRGGGSIEDLWAFNEESVARAIFACPIPIVSAVGHEIDFTISDLVADLRAPTPTGAAEIVVPNITDILNYISQVKIRISEAIKNKIEQEQLKLTQLKTAYVLKKPLAIYEIKGQKLDNLVERLVSIMTNKITYAKSNCFNLIKQLEILNPLKVIKRGYAVVKKQAVTVSMVNKLKIDDLIDIYLKDGLVKAMVKEIKEE